MYPEHLGPGSKATPPHPEQQNGVYRAGGRGMEQPNHSQIGLACFFSPCRHRETGYCPGLGWERVNSFLALAQCSVLASAGRELLLNCALH